MGKVSSISITDSGRYYTLNPTVIIDPPPFDSTAYAALDSVDFKFGCGSLLHDSVATSTMGVLPDNYGQNKYVMQSFWIKLDSNSGTSTLLYSDDFRVFVDSDLKIGFSHYVNATNKDSGQLYDLQVHRNNNAITRNNWHFIKIETNNSNLRINVDSNIDSNYMNIAAGNHYIYDAGDSIYAGKNTIGEDVPFPLMLKNGSLIVDSNLDRSFSGRFDNYQFTVDSTKSAFSTFWSSWVPDSAGETYENEPTILYHHFDFKVAKADAFIDSSTGKVNRVVITDSGCGYDSAPGVRFVGGNTARDSTYNLGNIVEQTFSSGIKIQGEVQWYTKDSALDSARYVSLAHVGADDGNYHTFIGGVQLINKTLNHTTGLDVISVEEQNKMSETEMNDVFSQPFVDDFLDFTEDNPFGDPENN
mgnify:CR=1 FL=1